MNGFLDSINPLSPDFVWWQVARKTGSLVAKGTDAVIKPQLGIDWTFWGTSAAVIAGAAVLIHNRKKTKRSKGRR